MKTTDLIPLILYQLVNDDKYGYEIVKQIEDSSGGHISIKQPTLYSLLKKLEQGKFISSYWRDSEIGGKRHYYTITENGRAQIDTYPPFQQLIQEATGLDTPIANTNKDVASIQNNVGVMAEIPDPAPIEQIEDKFEDDTRIKPIEIDLTTSTSSLSLDNSIPNDSLVKEDYCINTLSNKGVVEETTVTERPGIEDVAPAKINIFDAIEPVESDFVGPDKFAENNSPISTEEPTVKIEIDDSNFLQSNDTTTSNKLYNKLSPTDMLLDNNATEEIEDCKVTTTSEQVPYLDYVDFSKDEICKSRKSAIIKRIGKMTLTCVTLLIIMVLTAIWVCKYSVTAVYLIVAGLALLIFLFYPIILLKNVSAIRLQYCTHPFRYSIARDFFVKLSSTLSAWMLILSYNIATADSIKNIFSASNCSNFYAPIILCGVIMLDFVYNVLFFKKYRK